MVVDYQGPLVAPVSKETRTGTARLLVGDVEIASVPVYPRVDVGAQDGVIGRSIDTLNFWVFGG